MCNSWDIQGQCPKLCCVRHWMPNLAASPVHVCIPVPSCWCHPRLCLMLTVSHSCPCPWYPMTIYKVTAPFPCLFHQCMSVCQHHYVESLMIVSDVDGQPLLFLFMHWLTICKATKPFPNLLNGYHTCTIHRHNLSVDVHMFFVLCSQVLDTTAHLFLVQSLGKLAIFQLILHWCGISCAAEDSWHFAVGTCTNIWQRNSLPQSFVSQENWNSTVHHFDGM